MRSDPGLGGEKPTKIEEMSAAGILRTYFEVLKPGKEGENTDLTGAIAKKAPPWPKEGKGRRRELSIF